MAARVTYSPPALRATASFCIALPADGVTEGPRMAKLDINAAISGRSRATAAGLLRWGRQTPPPRPR